MYAYVQIKRTTIILLIHTHMLITPLPNNYHNAHIRNIIYKYSILWFESFYIYMALMH